MPIQILPDHGETQPRGRKRQEEIPGSSEGRLRGFAMLERNDDSYSGPEHLEMPGFGLFFRVEAINGIFLEDNHAFLRCVLWCWRI